MNDIARINHAELDLTLNQLQFGVGASDLHGSLTGFLCGGGVASARNWLEHLEIEPGVDVSQADRQSVLDGLFRGCRSELEDAGLRFLPLLPGDEEPLTERADALVEWCRGFLGGLGLSGVDVERGLSEDGAEILRDLSTIAASRFEYEDVEEDETALVEVLEFVRVGVLLLHSELASSAAPVAGTLH
ncbi:MAG: UPF0149 family protein [Tahibacter sp.]